MEELKKNNNLDKSIVKLEISLSSPDLKSVNKSIIENEFYKLLTDYFQRNWFEKFTFKLRQRMAYIKHKFNF